MSQDKQKTHWMNWFIPALLILIALLILLFYDPSPVTSKADNTSRDSVITGSENTNNNEFHPEAIANTLVSTFFNGSDEDVADQLSALENTLNHLSKTTNKEALSKLRDNNINDAIKVLVKLSIHQENLRESAKTWINIGNIQNLTSAKQALQAYTKASELDPNNSNAWSRQGHIHRQLKQFNQAEKAYKKVQALGNQGEANQAFALANFGLLNQSKGDLVKAEKAFNQALEIYADIKNDSGIASTSENLASLYIKSEQFEQAETHYLKALEIYQKLEQPQNISTLHSALGSLYQTLKLGNKAQTHYEKALEISLNNNFKVNIASLYSNLGILAQQNGKLEKSRRYFEKSLELNQDINRTNGTADQYGNLAILNRNKKDFAKAEDYHKKAIDIYRHNNHPSGIISQKINLGFLYKVWNKPAKACQTWQETLVMLKQVASKRTSRVEQLIANTCK